MGVNCSILYSCGFSPASGISILFFQERILIGSSYIMQVRKDRLKFSMQR